MRGKYSDSPVMPPSFGLPPAIQKISAKDDSANVAATAALPHALGEPRKTAQPVLQGFGGDAERQRAGRGAGRILRVVEAAQRTDAADPCDLAARGTGGPPDGF